MIWSSERANNGHICRGLLASSHSDAKHLWMRQARICGVMSVGLCFVPSLACTTQIRALFSHLSVPSAVLTLVRRQEHAFNQKLNSEARIGLRATRLRASPVSRCSIRLRIPERG